MFGDHGLCGLLEEGAHGKSPKCLGGNLGDFGEFCKGLGLFDANEWGVSVAATFGYRAKEITKKARKPIEEMVTWVE